MQLIIILILYLKIRVIRRECNNEIDTSRGYPEHELMDHYIFYKNLMVRCTKCMQRIYSGYHFMDRCINNRTGLISSTHSYIDYIDIINSNDNIDNSKDDKDNKNDLNKVLNELKDNIKEDVKEYIRDNLKQEIINELKLEIKNEIKKEVKNEIEGGAINNLKTEVYIKNPSKQIKSTRTCFFLQN